MSGNISKGNGRQVTRKGFTWFFKQADKNGDGYLTFDELKEALAAFDYRGDNRDVRYMFTVTDMDNDDRLSFEEYMEAMGQFPERMYLRMILLRTFSQFDKNSDGQISREEFHQAVNELGRHMTKEQVNEIMEAADIDNSKTLDYNEFTTGIFGVWGRCDILDMFFAESDTDKDGYLSLEELLAMMRKLGYTASNTSIKELFSEWDTSGDKKLSYDEFMAAMGVTPENGTVDKSALMRRVFLQFDKNGDGKIDEKEMKTALAEMGKHFSEKQLAQIMKQADKDGSGGLDYEEFIEHITVHFQNHDAFEQFFKEADVDHSNSLTLKELTDMLRKHGYSGSDRDIQRMFMETDGSGNDDISFEEYMIAMGRQPQEVHSGAIMRNVFLGFDENGDGKIDRKELRKALQAMGQKMSRRQTRKVMQTVDKDGSGALDYEEFIQAVLGAQKGK